MQCAWGRRSPGISGSGLKGPAAFAGRFQRGLQVSLVKSVQVAAHPAARLEQVIGVARQARLVRAAGEFRARLGGRTVWNVSSTAAGGGVAEMLQVLVGYAEDL